MSINCNDSPSNEEPYPSLLIPEILKFQSETTPDKISYIFLHDGETDQEVFTCRDLYNESLKVATILQKMEAPGERVLLLFAPGMKFITALYGCFLSGAIAVPAYPPRKNRSLDRIRSLVSDSGARFILSTSDIYNSCERSFSGLIELKDQKWILTDTNDINTSIFRNHITRPQDIALLQYTSGSTGMPKGVMVTHKNIIRNLEFIRQSFKLSLDSVSVSWLPSFHDMGLIDAVIGSVYNGYMGVLMPPVCFIQKPIRWLKAISKYSGTHGGAPNFAFDLCVDQITEEERKGLDLSTLTTLYCGAEPIRKETLERFIKTYSPYGISSNSIYPCYGMAETTLIISGIEAGKGPTYLNVSSSTLEINKIEILPEGDNNSKQLVSVGHPWIDTEVRIVNTDNLTAYGDDMIGEIWVNGSIVTAGYWNNPGGTEQAYHATILGEESEFLRTGDLGFFHDGELYITGRLKDMIIIQGKNYYPHDIEHVTEKSHPALRSCSSAAFSVEIDNVEHLVIVAEVERTYIRDLDVEEVCNAIRQNVFEEFEQAVYAIQLLRTASILKTSSGKIQRKDCKKGFINKSLDVVGESIQSLNESASNEIRHTNASVLAWLMLWIHLKLNIALDKIDVSRNLGQYGLNSLKALQLQQAFMDKYKISVPPFIFDKISLLQLSEKAMELINDASNYEKV